MSDNLKSNIPTHELKLSNGDIVVFYDYLTTGESRQLQKLLLACGKFNAETGKIEDLPIDQFLDIQDKSAESVIKEVKVAEADAADFSQDWLNSLPVEVGNEVYEEVNRITQVSNLAKEEKKN